MERFSLLEKSNLFRNAMLATKVSQVLQNIEKGGEINKEGYAIISRATEMLKQIIEGSILIERKGAMNGFSPSQEGLSVYGHALSALEKLDLVKKEKDFTDLFIELHGKMTSLAKKETIEKEVVSILKSFFNILSQLFGEDIQKESFKEPISQTTFYLNKSSHCVIT